MGVASGIVNDAGPERVTPATVVALAGRGTLRFRNAAANTPTTSPPVIINEISCPINRPHGGPGVHTRAHPPVQLGTKKKMVGEKKPPPMALALPDYTSPCGFG